MFRVLQTRRNGRIWSCWINLSVRKWLFVSPTTCVYSLFSLLSSLRPNPAILIGHFFAVALYAMYRAASENACHRPHLALFRPFFIFLHACHILFPLLSSEFQFLVNLWCICFVLHMRVFTKGGTSVLFPEWMPCFYCKTRFIAKIDSLLLGTVVMVTNVTKQSATPLPRSA